MAATFDDGKDAGALRTIGELGQALGLKPHVLRYWEEQFPMLQPLKRSGGRRYYRPADVALVETIDRLVNHEGYTLKGARQAIEEGKTARPAAVEVSLSTAQTERRHQQLAGSPPVVAAREITAELKGIRERLAAAVGA